MRRQLTIKKRLMYSLGGKSSKLAGASNNPSMVSENHRHSSPADTSPRLNVQNLGKKHNTNSNQ